MKIKIDDASINIFTLQQVIDFSCHHVVAEIKFFLKFAWPFDLTAAIYLERLTDISAKTLKFNQLPFAFINLRK